MGEVINWIKKSVGLCASIYTHSDDEILMHFKEYEREYNDFSEEQKDKVRELLKAQFALEDLIYILSIFISKMNISDFYEDILCGLINWDYTCLEGSMYEVQIEANVKGFYKLRRELHKKHIDSYVKELKGCFSYIPYEQRNKNRIVIVTEQILGIRHAPTKMVLDYALVMQKMGYEVLIISCPSDMNLSVDKWYNCRTIASCEDYCNQKVRIDYENTSFTMFQFNMNDNVLQNYSNMLNIIYQFKPLFSLNGGVTNPVADLVSDITTVVAYRYSVGLPISEAEILVAGSHNQSEEKCLTEKQVLLHVEKTEQYFEESGNVITRGELGIPEDAFSIAIVGNRLDSECDDDFITVMEEIIDKIPNVCFVVIGDTEVFKRALLKRNLQKNVCFLGYCNDLIATLKTVDLYINPKRNGGGYSSVMAIVAGVPVVTLPNCDVSNNTSESFVVSNYNDMILEVCRYYEDENFYSKQIEAVNNVASTKTKANMEKNIMEIVNKMLNYVENYNTK